MKKPIELTNGISLYCKSMGKLFRVYAICETVEAANSYCSNHKDAAVIAEDPAGRIYLADVYESTIKSERVKDPKQKEITA